jgi:HEAT repeat protein
MKSSEDIDRVAAARLLGGRDANEAIPALTAALSDPSGDVRRSAAVGLGGFGDKAKAAAPELQKLLKDRDARVRDSAATALHRIDPGKFPAPKPPKGK